MNVHQDRITGELLTAPEIARDAFALGPFMEYTHYTSHSPVSINTQCAEALRNRLELYPEGTTVTGMTPALSTYIDTSGDYPVPALVALFTVTVEIPA